MADAVPHPPAIEGFEFQEVLGSGGFSDVFRYRQRFPRRSVAIKVLHATTADKQSRHQFIAEANTMAQLSNHPAIATIFDAGVSDDDRPYLIMEFCSRGSLGTTYRQNPLPADQVLRIGVRVASALESAHRLGIVHRDVKPANILITDYGSAVLSDFGISVGDDELAEATVLRAEQTTTASLASDASTHGLSVPWAPPEALDDTPVIDARSDVYSLGATLFSLLEGRSPFEQPGGSNGALQLSRRIERGAVVPGDRVDASPDLAVALRRAMAVDPKDRPATALGLAQWLTGVEAAMGLAQTPIELLGDTLDPAEPTASIEALEATRMRTVAPAVATHPVGESVEVTAGPSAKHTTDASPPPSPSSRPIARIADDARSEPSIARAPSSRFFAQRKWKLVVAGAGLVVALAISGVAWLQSYTAYTADLAEEIQVVVRASGADLVYWTAKGETYHLCTPTANGGGDIYSGTVSEAHDAGRLRPPVWANEQRRCGFRVIS